MSITNKILEIVAEQKGDDVEEIAKDTNQSLSDMGLDSIDISEVMMRIEDEIGIHIPDAQWEELKTLQQIIDFVEAKA